MQERPPGVPCLRVSAVEAALIHAPIALFALAMIGLLLAACAVAGAARVGALVAAWWSACGCIMMVVDARGRGERYGRLACLDARAGKAVRCPRLRDTVCGLFMAWALRYRRHLACRNLVRKGA